MVPSKDDRETAFNLRDSSAIERGKAAGAPLAPLAPPRGFSTKFAEADIVQQPAGNTYLGVEFYQFESPDQYPVTLSIRRMKPGAVVDLVAYEASAQHTYSRLDLAGVPALVVHGTAGVSVQPAMQAWIVVGDYLIYADAPALPPEILTEFIAGLIATHNARLEAATTQPAVPAPNSN